MSTSAALGSVPAREGGRVLMLTKGSSIAAGGGGEVGGEGLDRRSTRGSGVGACYVRVERSARLELVGYDQVSLPVACEASASGTR